MKTLPSAPVSTAMFPPGPFEDAHIASKLVHLNRSPGSLVTDQVHDVAGLGKDLSWAQPASTSGESCRAEAAQAKAPPRNRTLLCNAHNFLHQTLESWPCLSSPR